MLVFLHIRQYFIKIYSNDIHLLGFGVPLKLSANHIPKKNITAIVFGLA